MKGVKVTLNVNGQHNLLANWREISGYDKSIDAIVTNVKGRKYRDMNISIPNPVINDVYTISFDVWGSTTDNRLTTHMYDVEVDNIVAVSEGGVRINNNGEVDWYNLSGNSKRHFVTYRLPNSDRCYVIIRTWPGTTYIRNIKLEKSPEPTDYEE